MMGLDEKTLNDFNDFMTNTVIPTLLIIADAHSIDRDSMIRFTADTFVAMSEVATFENYQLPGADGAKMEVEE